MSIKEGEGINKQEVNISIHDLFMIVKEFFKLKGGSVSTNTLQIEYPEDEVG